MAFTYKLEHEDGTPADPPTFRTAVPTWNAGEGDLRVRPRRKPERGTRADSLLYASPLAVVCSEPLLDEVVVALPAPAEEVSQCREARPRIREVRHAVLRWD